MDNKPMFVKVEEYEGVLETLNAIKEKLDDAKEILAKVTELKEQEDAEIESWHVGIKDIEQKLSYVDKMIFEP
jgi:predicted nuclease with TOPRIM domain